jgi:hypothetical protein
MQSLSEYARSVAVHILWSVFKTVINAMLSYQLPYTARPRQLGCVRDC